MGKTIVINQPYYFPQLHWWKRNSEVDAVVLLNDVIHNTNYPVNRFVVFHGGRETYLTIPIKGGDKRKCINEIEVSDNLFWAYKHENAIRSYYRKYKYFHEIDFYFDHIWNVKTENILIKIIIESIIETNKVLGLNPNIISSSSLNISETKNDRLIAICKKLGADKLVLGMGSKNYVESEIEKYNKNDIAIIYQDWQCPVENYSILHSIAKYGIEETKYIIG